MSVSTRTPSQSTTNGTNRINGHSNGHSNGKAPERSKLSRWADCRREIIKLEARLEALEKQAGQLEPAVHKAMLANGVDFATINGLPVQREVMQSVKRCKRVSEEQMCDLLIKAGRSDLTGLSYSPATIKRLALNNELPAPVMGALEVVPVPKLKVRA